MPSIDNRFQIDVEDHIAHITMSRPEKMNALDHATFEAIHKVDQFLRADSSIRCVVLSGQGGNFCSGLDKSNFESLFNKSSDQNSSEVAHGLEARTHGIANHVQYIAWLWRELPMPVIVAIEGVAFGGGLQIALGGDIRYASASSQFSIMELKWGLVPDMSSSQVMRHLIRDDVIRELTYTARIFDAQEALRHGFITDIVESPLESALAKAQEIASKNPHAIRAAKRIIDKSYYQSAAEGLLTESIEQDQIIGKPNQVEAVMANLQKRAPNFKD